MNLLFIGAGIAGVLLLFLITAFSFRTVVSTNDVHIVQAKKSTTVYGKGHEAGNVYYKWPAWIPVLGVRTTVFPVSNFSLKVDSYEAYDKGRLPFLVDVMAFFRIEDATLAAGRISNFSQLQEQLMGILQGACRTILAGSEIEAILEGRGEFGQKFTDEVDHNLTNWGVKTVKNIEFMDIRDAKDSKVIQQIMAKKKSEIERESRVVVAGNVQQAELSEIEAKQQVALRNQEADEAIGIRDAERVQKVGLASEKSKQEIAQEAATTMTKQMEVISVDKVRNAQIQKETQIIFAQQEKETQLIDAEREKQRAIILAEGQKAQQVTVAEGKKEAAILAAQGIEAEGKAKGIAEEAILMAPVNAQTKLAAEIGTNTGYQTYLLSVRKVESDQAIGIEQAKALAGAEIKIIANTGDVGTGLSSVGGLFSPKGGTQLAGAVEAFAQSPVGRELLNAVTGGTKE